MWSEKQVNCSAGERETRVVADYISPIVVKFNRTFLLMLLPAHRCPFTLEAHTKP